MEFTTYCPVWKHTRLTSHLVHIVVYSQFISFITLSVDTSFHAVVPLGTLVSLLMSRARCQQSQPTPLTPSSGWQLPASCPGDSPAGGKWHLSQIPTNATSNNLFPNLQASLLALPARFTIFSLQGTFSIRGARNFIKAQHWFNSSSLWRFSLGKSGRIDSRLFFPLHNAMVLPTHTTDLQGCFILGLLFPLEQHVGFNVC